MNRKQCSRCEYSWVSRIINPKECPRCKNRLDKTRAGAEWAC